MKANYRDDSHYIDKEGYSSWEPNKGNYDIGTLYLPNACIDMYMEGDERFGEITRLDVTWKGRRLIRTYNKRYSKQYAVTLAKRFWKEIKERDVEKPVWFNGKEE